MIFVLSMVLFRGVIDMDVFGVKDDVVLVYIGNFMLKDGEIENGGLEYES